jgi:hypothetical protein
MLTMWLKWYTTLPSRNNKPFPSLEIYTQNKAVKEIPGEKAI